MRTHRHILADIHAAIRNTQDLGADLSETRRAGRSSREIERDDDTPGDDTGDATDRCQCGCPACERGDCAHCSVDDCEDENCIHDPDDDSDDDDAKPNDDDDD
jgi:hypothetical protein